jgi:hypothetical protein
MTPGEHNWGKALLLTGDRSEWRTRRRRRIHPECRCIKQIYKEEEAIDLVTSLASVKAGATVAISMIEGNMLGYISENRPRLSSLTVENRCPA